MTSITTHTEYAKAVNEAKYHNYLYFVKSSPIISDEEFDQLYYAIEQYETQHPDDILPDSPTQLPGSDLTEGSRTIPHRYPMLSTKKIKADKAEVVKWMRSAAKAIYKMHPHYIYSDVTEAYTLEWKYDGCSCSIVYQDGVLIEASTRGDTKKNLGRDILLHANAIPSIPKQIPGLTGRVEIRGEILMPFSHYDTIPDGTYSDPRTSASAIINTQSVTPYDHLLEFIAWQMIVRETAYYRINEGALIDIELASYSHDSSMKAIDEMGFQTGGCEIVTMSNVSDAIAECERQRKLLDFPTDGLVIKVRNTTLWDSMGHTDHHHKFCVAYKFAPLTTHSVCTRIEITVGETGRRTPICYFDPVTMNGKTYNKASLGSEAVMTEKGIAPGKCIEVALANDVIPQVIRVIED